MRRTTIELPVLAAIAGTRGMLGAGVALLLADRMHTDTRRALGFALLAIGIASTVPLALIAFRRSR